jgi:hypothetical protein
MKTKKIVTEILLICLFLTTLLYAFYVTSLDYISSFGSGFVMGLCCGYYVIYWQMKNQIEIEERPNMTKIINTWRYIMVGSCLGLILLAFLFQNQILTSDRFWLGYFFLMAMVMGNYRAKIEPNFEPSNVYLEDEEVRRKTKRFSGWLSVMLGLLAIAATILLDSKNGIYLMSAYLFLTTLAPYFYAKYEYNRKFA